MVNPKKIDIVSANSRLKNSPFFPRTPDPNPTQENSAAKTPNSVKNSTENKKNLAKKSNTTNTSTKNVAAEKSTRSQEKIAKTAPIPDQPLKKTPIETPNPKANGELQWLKDIVGLAVFVVIVALGAWLINLFIFRSFNVVGPSMEPTLEGQGAKTDRLIVNIVPVTLAKIGGNDYVPPRGEIIVFKNPNFQPGNDDEFIVKRVIAMPGERVTVKSCQLLVHNQQNPNGFDPYQKFANLAENDKDVNTCVDGDGTDVTVPQGEIFVVGDHRVANYSMDSRNGGGRATLGTIPLENIIGPVSLRIWPLDKWQMF